MRRAAGIVAVIAYVGTALGVVWTATILKELGWPIYVYAGAFTLGIVLLWCTIWVGPGLLCLRTESNRLTHLLEKERRRHIEEYNSWERRVRLEFEKNLDNSLEKARKEGRSKIDD